MGSTVSIQSITSIVPACRPLGLVARSEATNASRRRKSGLEYVYRGILAQYGRHVERSEDAVLEGWSSAGAALGVEWIPVEREKTLSEMAVQVSQAIADPVRPFTTIIFCHLMNDEEFSVSAACRLQCEVAPSAFAFAVSQQQGASPVTAMMLARSLLEHEPDMENVLVVSADKWFSPFSRRVGSWSVHGDAAAALSLGRGGGGHRLVGATCRTTTPVEPDEASADPHTANAILASAVIRAMQDLFDETGVTMSDVSGFFLSAMNPQIAQEVARRVGRTPSRPHGRAYLGCSDTIVVLEEAVRGAGRGDLILICAVGESGHAGCLLVERGMAA